MHGVEKDPVEGAVLTKVAGAGFRSDKFRHLAGRKHKRAARGVSSFEVAKLWLGRQMKMPVGGRRS